MERQEKLDRAKRWSGHVRAVVCTRKNHRRRNVIAAAVCALLLSGAGFMTQRAYAHWEKLDRQARVAATQDEVRQAALQQTANSGGGASPQPGPARSEPDHQEPAALAHTDDLEAAAPAQTDVQETTAPAQSAVPEEGKEDPRATRTPLHRDPPWETLPPQEAVPSYTTQPESEPPAEDTETQPPSEETGGGSYTALYPELYAAPALRETLAPDYTVYLTFDDGPSARTAEVLDILQANGIKATFFVTGQTSELAQAMMRRIVAEGHTIGVHTYTHNYREIYASVEAYLADFERIYNWVYQVTGVYPQIFRFPGGTVNGFNGGLYRALVDEMDRRGFVHYDWNAMCGDADGKIHTPEELAQNSLAMLGGKHVIVLMHDSAVRQTTVACLPAVIAGYRSAGYSFAPLTPEIRAITFDN